MVEEKLQEVNHLTQNLQAILFQKQAFNLELNEVLSALEELGNSGDEVYKIIGQMFLKSDKVKIKLEFENKKKFLENRLNILDKQESEISKEIENLRSQINTNSKK